eukprot:13091237-Alexandrium_andersonii.AAC.1
MRTDCGKNIRIYSVGVAMVTLLRHAKDRQVRHHMDTADWVAASTLLQTETMKRFGELSEEDLRILIEWRFPEGPLPHGVGAWPA